ncbi:hypothetical protein OX283_004325 [Flavobacterium sp. SUN052]|uniref:hypothetical protein n=1 Tax=Flavobacterium sp. SUN052 TaxID=3002441 RepID=UPI00237D9AD5|nr:hypothetical protein [Flavobacterium sp. SUN052]MEC4003872.1 hypothetical protein [Flavobacterium sp. SUN052]
MLFCTQIIAQTNEKKVLNKITGFSIKDSTQLIDNDSLLKKFIKIQLIDKKLFLQKKKTAVEFLVSDTTKIRKTKGVIKLPIQKGFKEYVDKDPFDETKQEFTYLGQIKFLNVYLVYGLYWEDLDYKFVSKIDGKEIQSFVDFPYISQNKKLIMSVYADPYATEAQLELLSLIKNKPQTIFYASFKNWMPAPAQEMFWGSDGSFYLPILYSTEYWKKDGSCNDNFSYIKITLI